MRITFHGAAGDVTGSCHHLEAAGKRFLVDCGMYQGSRRLVEENADAFGFDPAGIDFLLLTHAHLDHCGRIPLLVKRGFHGRIFTTAATLDLAKLVLLDAAALQQEDNHHHAHGGHPNHLPANGNGRHPDAAPALPPLYDAGDVQQALSLFEGSMVYGVARDLAPGIRATFRNAGHILGSASILLEIEEAGRRSRLVFSGDLGNRDKPILDPPAPAPPADIVVMESTYGDRNHRSQADSVREFQQAITAALGRGGNVVIPTFALERAQDLLYYLREMVEQQLLPPSTPVFLDSPMAISATDIFRHHPECVNAETAGWLASGRDPFAVPGLHMTRDTQASIAINSARGAIIMAGSGMASGGRILHHLQHNLGDPGNSVIFVGYAAAGTVARQIIDGAHTVHLYGDVVPVRAQVTTIGGFSAHADHDDLIRWVRSAGTDAQIYLVHGEAAAAAKLGQDMNARGLHAHTTAPGQVVEIGASRSAASPGA
ncbi:MAG TPA: MBL fold metallo-hydrolase [Terriglobales bacterium]|nr:MBL fold metallo-hydrolase [Terriglobales bacterium]